MNSSSSHTPLDHLDMAIPETELLDNSIQKGKAELSVKTRRSCLSRSNYYDSRGSTEGDGWQDRKVPYLAGGRNLHLSQRGRSPENTGTPLAAPQKGRYQQLTNAASQEALVSPSSSHSKLDLSSDCSPVYLSGNKWPEADGNAPLQGAHRHESALGEEFSAPQTSSSSIPSSTVDSNKSSHQYQTLSQSSDEPWDESFSSVSSWTPQQVCQWLKGLNMERYIPEFIARDVDGEQLLQMNGSRLKGLGVLCSSDRSVLKQHIKDVQTAAVKERKALDKWEKKKEKQRKKEQRRN
uniref:Sterile alpha motif domain containing 14 n=1 Tax=Oryzias latipes TaxID=8090 RepID=A0A3P9LHV6_ORYLA